jgi:hypothetical protein
MSRQAVCQTEVFIKDESRLIDAVKMAADELNGTLITSVRYYAGKILSGIRAGNAEIGIIVKDGKLCFVGEDIHLNSEIGKKIRETITKNYATLGVARALNKAGYKTTVRKAQKNLVVGVRS